MKICLKETTEGIDLNVVRETHMKIKELRKISRSLRKDDAERTIIQTKLQGLRQELNNFATMIFRLEAQSKRNVYWEVFIERPSREDIKTFKTAFRSRIAEARKELQAIKPEDKEMIGFKYKMIGGVMVKPATIFDLLRTTNPLERVRAHKAPMVKSKHNFVGVEIEMIAKCDKSALEHLLITNGLAGYVRVGTDGSVRTEKPGEVPHELTIMCKQEDLKSVFNKLNNVLTLPYVDAYVNNSCGLHVHIDCRNRDHKRVYKNLVNCLPVLIGMVPADRLVSEDGTGGNTYCLQNTTDDFDKFNMGERQSRYQMINAQSFNKYKTIEIRLHSGSTNPVKIVNWAKLLVAIAESKEPIDTKVNSVAALGELLSLPTKMINYMERRTELFKTKQIGTTRDDHFSTINFEMAV